MDPKFAFEDVEEELEGNNKISSLKKLLENKRNRSGYSEKRGQTLYLETDFSEFLDCADPYEFLATYNKFNIDEKAKELFKKVPPPPELETSCMDIKVCGKRELHNILKYRYRHNTTQDKEKKKEKELIRKQNTVQKELTEEELEAKIDKELEDAIKKVEKDKKRMEKKDRVKKGKSELRQKMSVIASSNIHNENDEVMIDKRTFEKLQELDIEDDDYVDNSDSEEENDDNPLKLRRYSEEYAN